MRVFSFLSVTACALAWPTGLLGQWPGEVHGVVSDALTGAPVFGATVELDGAQGSVTGPSGRYRLTGLPPGALKLGVNAPGYVGVQLDHTAINGRVDRVDIALQPSPFQLAPIEASGRTPVTSLGTALRIDRAQIVTSGARTLGDAVREMPGVVVVQRGVGSAQTLSLRGSDADAVLVLVDGVPLNDPVSGEADLSTVPADAIEQAQLHVGAGSARFGPRAGAGVLEVTTGGGTADWLAQGGAGSLGATEIRLERTSALGGWSVGASGAHSDVDGGFGYILPVEVGGAASTRTNADQRTTSVQLSADRSGATYARLRAGVDVLNRGLPGPGFRPSLHARQEAVSTRASANVGRIAGPTSVRVVSYFTHARRRFLDPNPPAGTSYDERSHLSEAATHLTVQRAHTGWLTTSEAGIALRSQWITSEALANEPGNVTDFGAFSSASVDPGIPGLRLLARVRVDGAGARREWHVSHALTAAWTNGPAAVELSHRSAFNPPTLADQFFREGVGTRPNPDLRAERIPSEFELATRFRSARVEGGVSTYVGDVQDRIVWQPDFRFVWSPTNTDVRRRGADGWLTLRPTKPLTVRASYSYARTTYDREGGADSVQLAYRPRQTGSASADWSAPEWSVGAVTRYTGERFPVPAPINALPAFWTLDVSTSRTWSRPTWSTEVVFRVQRLLDARDTLIFGFPNPGRTFALQLRFRRDSNSTQRTP